MEDVAKERALRAVLLGPQRLAPTLDRALYQLEVAGKVAIVTAGWQEREAEDQELLAALGRPGVNLMLHARGDEVFAADPELFAANRAKQDRLKQLQELYRRRLTHAMAAARHMQRLHESERIAPRELTAPQLTSAIAAVRRLDDEHAAHVRSEIAWFYARYNVGQRPAVARHRAELQAIARECDALAIAGGHVAVLLNRLRLFAGATGLGRALTGLPVVAWSAGAMVLTGRIVLFHDSPPQGRGNAEVLGDGLDLVPGRVALPHARRRLLLGDRRRIALLARRFAPAQCVTLDERAWMRYESGTWKSGPEALTLTPSGATVPGPDRHKNGGHKNGQVGGRQ